MQDAKGFHPLVMPPTWWDQGGEYRDVAEFIAAHPNTTLHSFKDAGPVSDAALGLWMLKDESDTGHRDAGHDKWKLGDP